MKKAAVLLFIFALVIIIIPAAVVIPFTQKAEGGQQHQSINRSKKAAQQNVIQVSVDRSKKKQTDQVALDDYLIGVVGSEMPAKFRIEALKAQAIAARTYIMARIIDNPDAHVTDTVQNQVYHSTQELKQIWGKDYEWKLKKVKTAVAQTQNQVITYNGKLIIPMFFSTSNGQTEDADNYWENDVPYLKSVASPWDKLSPKYRNEKKMTIQSVEQALGITLGADRGFLGKVISKTDTGHIARIEIAGKTFTGRQVREKLKLSSTDFQLTQNGNQVKAVTIGNGHDVGMSQYGAEGMAREGKTAKQILTYFYQGTQISKMTVKSKAQKQIAKK
ncbi:stage II sporulation protein D [Sporolactobacillus shoreicorticis]|uniref:Stage II sporulation protein D n=1 Tax=Sporolactobacillus shoreicorticis TaxID=1923877 RepID=A0ABW5S2Z8_9BACL|nr:stage II sporulation protein D [Sporolactobacillus shoreicorticis]MCO7127687.1 stage II sporulation protein D [Sporolactobacillus shoreicorticis]